MQKKMEMSEENSNQSNKNPVTKETLHDTIYQLKLLMIFFRRGCNEKDFKVFTEVRKAKKFEDFIFQCKNGNENRRFLQVKYFQNINKKITSTDLMAERGPFSLQKLFQSWRRIKIKKDFEGMKKDFVVCTNIDIDENLLNCFEKVHDESKMLKHNNQSSRLLKFKIQNFPRCDDLVKSLRSSSEVRRFATALARWTTTEKEPILNQDHIFYYYFSTLGGIFEEHVSARMSNRSDKIRKRFQMKFRKEFLKGDQEKLLRIREAFCEAVRKMSKNALDDEEIWVKMGEKVLKITGGFEKKLKKLKNSSTFEVTNFPLPDDNISMEDIEDFFKNLTFVVHLTDKEELDEMIETDIRLGDEMFNRISTPFIASEVRDHVIHWMKSNQNKCLTGEYGINYFKKAKDKLFRLSLIEKCTEFKAIIKNFDIAFNEKLPELQNFLHSSRKQIFNLINPHKPALSSIKVVSILNGTEPYKKDGVYIFNSLTSLLRIKDHVIRTFKKLRLLIIECEGNEENFEDFFTKLSTVLEKSANKKIILITQKDNSLANKFKENFYPNKYEEKYDNFNKLTDLTITSQKKLLNKGKVQFQGEEVSLKDLIDDGAKELINGEILFQLIKGEKIEAGIKRPGLYDLESFYHITSVKIEREQLSGAFKKNDNSLFVLIGINKYELSEIIPYQDFKVEEKICLFREDVLISENKYVILTEDEDEEKCIGDFKQICRDYSLLKTKKQQFSAYLIKKKNNILTWICSYNPSLYVNRKLYQVVIEKDSLREIINKNYTADERKKKRDIFAISNIKDNEFEYSFDIKVSNNFPTDEESVKVNHICILNGRNEEDSFRRFSNPKELRRYYNIHWLQNKERNGINYLIWRLSEGELDVITKLKQVEVDEMCIDEKELRTEKVVIIAGDSGIGKSTTLAHLLGESDESEWIIKLDLKNLEKELRTLNNMEIIDDFIESFFSKINIGMEGKFAKSLFKHKIMSQGKITFLFDGFDKITVKSQKTVIKSLKLLKNTKANFRITTRLHDEGKLRKCLSMPSYTFRPFKPEDQQNFFNDFWKIRLKFSDVSKDYILEKAKVYCIKSEEADWKVMRIPLIMRMFAEVYQEAIKESYKFDNQDEFEDIKNLSMSYVCERFISIKYKVFVEKVKVPDYLKNTSTLTFNKDHQDLALWKLFPQHAEILTDKYEVLSSENKKCLTSIGIVKSDSSNTDLYFNHQTFAEYFAARFLFRIMKGTNCCPKYMDAYKVLLFEILDNKYKLVREFIDEMIIEEDSISKWREIQDNCLAKTIGERRIILLRNKVPSCSFIDIKKFMENFFNGNLKAVGIVIEAFVQWFLHETDIELLETAINFFISSTERDVVSSLNKVYLLDKISTAAMHYYKQFKQNDPCGKKLYIYVESIERNFGEIFSSFNQLPLKWEEPPTDENIQEVINFLIPSNGVEPAEWIKLNNVYYFLTIFHRNFNERMKTYVISESNIQQHYAFRLFKFLLKTKFPLSCMINTFVTPWNLTSLQSLFLHIIDDTADQSIISDIKAGLNEIFKIEDRSWLEQTGIFISSFLQILTDEMSTRLISVLSEGDKRTVAYSKYLLEFLVYPILDALRKKDLPHIDKVALMNMLENSFFFSVKYGGSILLTHKQLQSMLQFVKKLLKEEKHQNSRVLDMMPRFIISLDTAGLQLLYREEVPSKSNSLPKYQYDYSSSHVNPIIEKSTEIRNRTEPRKNVPKKSCVRAESRALGRKRKSSETNLTELKRSRIVE